MQQLSEVPPVYVLAAAPQQRSLTAAQCLSGSSLHPEALLPASP